MQHPDDFMIYPEGSRNGFNSVIRKKSFRQSNFFKRIVLLPTMNRFAHAARHGTASVVGWLRLFFAGPGFACELLRQRWRYFVRREFEPGLTTPDGFPLQTSDMLIAYWSMFVERELCHAEWVRALQSVSQPLVLDVGANAGLFSHLVYCLNHQAEIIAFEPLPAMVEHINALKGRTGLNLRCIAKAVGRAPGQATLESPHGYD